MSRSASFMPNASLCTPPWLRPEVKRKRFWCQPGRLKPILDNMTACPRDGPGCIHQQFKSVTPHVVWWQAFNPLGASVQGLFHQLQSGRARILSGRSCLMTAADQ